MAADIFGQAVYDYVSAVFDGLAEYRGGDRVVDDERHTTGVGGLGQRGQIDDVACWVADALAVDCLGLVVDKGGDGLGAVILAKRTSTPKLGSMWANKV